ncbi:MAG: substrate-binding domain-containing protein, partial [Pseudomonadota bacterium]
MTTADEAVTIQGEFVSFENNVYTVNTVIGEISINGDGVTCEGPGCPGAVDTTVAIAEPEDNSVILTNPAGGVRLEGNLISFENGIYTVETIIGQFDVFADGTACEGPGCPEISDPQQAVATLPQAEEQIPTIVAPPLPAPDESALIRLTELAGPFDLTIAGPSTIIPHLLPALSETFAEAEGQTVFDPGVQLVSRQEAEDAGMPAGSLGLIIETEDGEATSVHGRMTTSSGEAYTMLADGTAHVAIVSVPAPVLSVDARTETMLGTEGMVAVVSQDNTVTDLSQEELAQIFSGQITNWSAVGGDDAPIRVLGLPETHDVTGLLNQMVLAPFRLSPETPEVLFGDAETLADAVDETRGAIAFIGAAARGDARPLALSSLCAVPTAPTAENIRTGRYPFARSYFAVSTASDNEKTAELLAFLDAQTPEIIAAAGLQPTSMDRFALTPDEDFLKAALPDVTNRFERLALSNALLKMSAADRLSVLLQTEPGGNRLNKTAVDQLQRLIDHAEDNELTELFFVGHSQDTGDLDNNDALG